jgi:homoserine kinase type II
MAVYTEVGDDELSAFLWDYDLGEPLAFKGIAEGVENSNFLLQTGKGFYILTIYERRVKAEDLPFFLGLMGHLAAAGIPCPTPVAARDGQALRRLGRKPAAIVGFLSGVWIRRPGVLHCTELGGAMARLHQAGRDFPMTRANDLSVDGWRRLVDLTVARADEVAPGLSEELSGELERLAAAWPDDLPTGVIHADLFPDNVFFVGDRLSGLIDFYFACTDALAYDLAIALNAWCFEREGEFNVTKARRLLAAYEQVRPLEPREREMLPLLARGAALRFLLTRLYDWLNQVEGALVRPKDPLEYRRKLRFHRGVDSFRAYGLDVR